jgi:hypothetical protein
MVSFNVLHFRRVNFPTYKFTAATKGFNGGGIYNGAQSVGLNTNTVVLLSVTSCPILLFAPHASFHTLHSTSILSVEGVHAYLLALAFSFSALPLCLATAMYYLREPFQSS